MNVDTSIVKIEDSFSEDTLGELNDILDEIDRKEMDVSNENNSSDWNNETTNSLQMDSTLIEIADECKQSVLKAPQEAPHSEFDEDLANICDFIEKEVELERILESSKNIIERAETSKNLEKEDNKIVDSLDSDKNSNGNINLTETPTASTSASNSDISLKMDVIVDQKSEKLEDPKENHKSSSKDKKTCDIDEEDFDKQLTVSPEKIINLLKKLSPDKLQVIKNQVFSNNLISEKPASVPEKPREEESPKVDVIESPSVELQTKIKLEPADDPKDSNDVLKDAPTVNDDCVILIDSDDEQTDTAKISLEPVKRLSVAEPEVSSKLVTDPLAESNSTLTSSSKRKLDDTQQSRNQKLVKKSKECVNPDCPHDSDDFTECHLFILNFYYTTIKLTKIQYVCSTCNEKAIKKYEELGEALLNNKPLFNVPMHSKQEMVEISDSEDEDEDPNDLQVVPESEKVDFSREFEEEIEEVLNDICGKIDLEKQILWEQEHFEKRCTQLEQDQIQFEEDLKEIERKSAKMYNDLYSISKPRFQRRKSIEIIHGVQRPAEKPQSPSELVNILVSKNRNLAKPSPVPPTPEAAVERPSSIRALLMKPDQLAAATPVQKSPPKAMVPSPATRSPMQPDFSPYYAVSSQVAGRMQNWSTCKLLEVTTKDNVKLYRVQFFESPGSEGIKVVSGSQIASNKTDPKLKIGSRVIAHLSRSKASRFSSIKKYLPGVIGEKLSKYNHHRYLVFFDYGQVQYVAPEEVREIMESSENVWEDVHENLRQFIFDYLKSQTMRQRALLNLRVHQQIAVERQGVWRNAKVTFLDCSLVKMRFPEDNSSEWIYRGSKRLGPLFTQGHRHQNMNARRNDPNISYITIDEDDLPTGEQVNEVEERAFRNTAKKSTSGRVHSVDKTPTTLVGPLQQRTEQQPSTSGQQPVIILNDNNIYLEEPKQITKYRHFTPRASIAAKKYVEHNCSPSCLTPSPNLAHHSPLSKPLLTCWERLIVRQKNNRWVQYKAPCGRRLRNMFEIRIYLMTTECPLNVDNFDFDVNIQVLHAYDVIDKSLCPLYIPDMSEGKEGMKIPVINAFDDTRPPDLEYSAVRIPMNGVKINTDPDFMACCDCTDDCADKTKCACFQMTIQGYLYANRGEDMHDEIVSYVWKRLMSVVTTGIYECNSRCKCTSRCLNKVVQNPIQIKMQLYRTKNRGWGLECCHDIPKGTFICIYAGRLYREDDANALCQGEDHGDEYFAELDLIETAEPLKEGFEPGVLYESSDSEEEKASDSDSDYDESKAREDELFTTPRRRDGTIVTRSKRERRAGTPRSQGVAVKDEKYSDSDDEMVSMLPTTGTVSGAQPKGNRSHRRLYGKNEKVFIMDAKLCGNVGRYFNHSCDPNLMVQSVFVDTHDMRFPWIAFFAMRAIKAGEELTWNYNYEVGSVPSKCLYCKCGSKNCRGRIL